MTFKILETVEIVYGDGFLRINKDDFKPTEHTLYGEEPAKSTEPAESDTREQRKLELETAPWQTLKALAAELEPPITEKPEGGWDEVIPLILEEEFS